MQLVAQRARDLKLNETNEDTPEMLQDRLAALDDRIARMRALNNRHGDAFALRLVKHAEIERKQLLELMPDRGRAPRSAP